MKIVITGANGFVGAAFCRYFHSKGHTVIAIGRQKEPPTNLLSFATYHSFDIVKHIEYFDADVCIHVAALANDKARYEDLLLNNVTGTKNVLEAAKHCRYFVYISSSSVYDFGDSPAIEADARIDDNISNYGRTKLLAEELLKIDIPKHQQRLILRPRAIYGIGDRILLPRIMKLLKFKTILYPASNNLQTSATNVLNIAYGIELFFAQQNKPELQILNIADSKPYFLKDMVSQILQAVEGEPLRMINLPPMVLKAFKYFSPAMVGPIALKTLTQNSLLDIGNIVEQLGYTPIHNFGNSVSGIGEWVKNIGGKKEYLKKLKDIPWILA